MAFVEDEDIVQAPMKIGDHLEQGIPSRSWGWITSFLGVTTPRDFGNRSLKYNGTHRRDIKYRQKLISLFSYHF